MTLLSISGGIDERFVVETRNIDASTASDLGLKLKQRIRDSKTLAIDVSRVEFIDSAGLGMLCQIVDLAIPAQVSLVGVSRRLAKGLARVPRLRDLHEAPAATTIRSA